MFPSIQGISVSPLREFCKKEIPWGSDRCDECLLSVYPVEFKFPESSARCEDLIESLTDLVEGGVSGLMQWLHMRGDVARIVQVQARVDGWGVLVLVRWRHELIEQYKKILITERG